MTVLIQMTDQEYMEAAESAVQFNFPSVDALLKALIASGLGTAKELRGVPLEQNSGLRVQRGMELI